MSKLSIRVGTPLVVSMPKWCAIVVWGGWTFWLSSDGAQINSGWHHSGLKTESINGRRTMLQDMEFVIYVYVLDDMEAKKQQGFHWYTHASRCCRKHNQWGNAIVDEMLWPKNDSKESQFDWGTRLKHFLVGQMTVFSTCFFWIFFLLYVVTIWCVCFFYAEVL